jgi:hypothetical protein
MSQNPLEDLARVVGFMNDIGSRHSKMQELSLRLQRAENLNELAAVLLRDGPKGFGGPEKWMQARDEWLKRYGLK